MKAIIIDDPNSIKALIYAGKSESFFENYMDDYMFKEKDTILYYKVKIENEDIIITEVKHYDNPKSMTEIEIFRASSQDVIVIVPPI